MEVAGQTFAVSLDVINSLYGEVILPFVRPLLVRRVSILVTIPHQRVENALMTYGQIGMLISQMKDHVVSRQIDPENPIVVSDLLEWAKRLPICEDTCIWVERNESVSQAISRLKSMVVSSQDDGEASTDPHPEDVTG